MNEGRNLPTSGIVIALVTGAVVIAAGGNPWLAGATVLVWIATFWLSARPPEPKSSGRPADAMHLTTTGMRALIENSGQPLLMIDGNRVIVANAAAREAVGSHVVGQDPRVAFRHPAAVDLLSQASGGTATVEGLSGPGSSWQMSYQPIDGRYGLIELINRTAEIDISRAHTDFVANASHELRTPLASIIGYMETLADEGTGIDPKLAQRFHGTVLREARRLQSLVEDLMSLSRIEAEKHDRPREQVDLNLLLAQASCDGAGPDRQDRLTLEIPEERLVVRGDAKQLEQLVRNLVDNALKYSTAESEVTVTLSRSERDLALVTVRDHGEGIAPEHIPYLTRRFYRTDPGRSRAAGGTGLGLAIVKHIVERHRGRLDIASRLGEGTTVSVRLPLAD